MTIRHADVLDDMDIEAALNGFVRNATPLDSDVRVEFIRGVASLRGSVPSLTVAQAIEDLVLAHDGVASVVNGLTLDPAAVRVEHARRSG